VNGRDGFSRMARKRRSIKKKRVSGGLACPFCGEPDEIFVDPGGGDAQVYTEDCAVCCRPRLVHVEPGDEPGEHRVWLERAE
jgi:cysteine-rich CPXCG protein